MNFKVFYQNSSHRVSEDIQQAIGVDYKKSGYDVNTKEFFLWFKGIPLQTIEQAEGNLVALEGIVGLRFERE